MSWGLPEKLIRRRPSEKISCIFQWDREVIFKTSKTASNLFFSDTQWSPKIECDGFNPGMTAQRDPGGLMIRSKMTLFGLLQETVKNSVYWHQIWNFDNETHSQRLKMTWILGLGILWGPDMVSGLESFITSIWTNRCPPCPGDCQKNSLGDAPLQKSVVFSYEIER